MEAQVATIDQPYHCAYEKFMEITSHLNTEMSCDKTHSEIEAYLETDGRELLRLLLQDHLDNQGPSRLTEAVCGADGVVRTHKRDHMESGYKSVFGGVRVSRTGYSQRGVASLFPRDTQLNLPARGYSHRLQKRVAAKAVKMSLWLLQTAGPQALNPGHARKRHHKRFYRACPHRSKPLYGAAAAGCGCVLGTPLAPPARSGRRRETPGCLRGVFWVALRRGRH
jgi:hypothetical protein